MDKDTENYLSKSAQLELKIDLSATKALDPSTAENNSENTTLTSVTEQSSSGDVVGHQSIVPGNAAEQLDKESEIPVSNNCSITESVDKPGLHIEVLDVDHCSVDPQPNEVWLQVYLYRL